MTPIDQRSQPLTDADGNNGGVFVSGCFDQLHSGHIAFLERAAAFGPLTVCIGSDRTIEGLKGRHPLCPEGERAFVLRALRCVARVEVGSGCGWLDFEPELRKLRPRCFVVNADGDRPEKRRLCEELGIEYIVLSREPHAGLAARSSSALREETALPYRIDLAGGWLDQPFVSRLHPGPVIVVSLEPTAEMTCRCGLATSTRKAAKELWGDRLPTGDPERLARLLFCYENPPGSYEISGSQDALGIVLPGLNKLNYEGEYWPASVQPLLDPVALRWLESHIYLLPTQPRDGNFRVLEDCRPSAGEAKRLAEAAHRCWDAVMERDLRELAQAVSLSFDAQVAMFPRMIDNSLLSYTDRLPAEVLGRKVAGAGGGGYLITVCERRPSDDFVPIRVRGSDQD